MIKRLGSALLITCVALILSMIANAGVKKPETGAAEEAMFQFKKVKGKIVTSTLLNKQYKGACSISPRNRYRISSEVSGELTYLLSETNTAKKGDLLLELKNPSIKLQFDNTVNDWKLISSKLKRSTGDGVVLSKVNLEELRIQEKNLRQQVVYLRDQIDSFSIFAPEDGMFEIPDLSIGDRISALQPLITFYGSEKLEFIADLPQLIFDQVDRESTIELTEVGSNEVLGTAAIDRYEPVASGTFMKIRGDIESVDNSLERDLFKKCNLNIALSDQSAGIFLEAKNVHLDYKGFYVYTVTGRRVEKKYIQIEWQDEGLYKVVLGLKDGEIVATDGSFRVFDNELVELVMENG